LDTTVSRDTAAAKVHGSMPASIDFGPFEADAVVPCALLVFDFEEDPPLGQTAIATPAARTATTKMARARRLRSCRRLARRAWRERRDVGEAGSSWDRDPEDAGDTEAIRLR
jgi:hypothetical protein